nr:ubiquitin-activating enzyme E1 1-like isoform X2 [Tanacetum cinerariifolium]
MCINKPASKVIVPDFQPKQGVKIDTYENVTNLSSASIDYSAVIDELIMKLESHRKILSSGYVMKPIQFEKDDDTNYHMDFIAGLANMRVKNYIIPDVDKLRTKFIVGRIILAIATSTAMATGLVCLELYKFIDGGRKVHRNRIISGSPVLETLVLCSFYGFEELDISNDSVKNFVICGYHQKWTLSESMLLILNR